MASFIHYNPSYFSRRFHQFAGFTFNEYLNRCRIDAASKILLETEKTISEIGLECGFPSVSSFITFFKRQHQVTPEKYRKSYSHERVKNTDFTVISNNCWGGMLYESYDLPKGSPPVGLFFMADDYIKFLRDLKGYTCANTHKRVLKQE